MRAVCVCGERVCLEGYYLAGCTAMHSLSIIICTGMCQYSPVGVWSVDLYVPCGPFNVTVCINVVGSF